MGKHKKFLKSEKAKVKLKGVKLPKGLNVTKTDFKVKKIIIKEQLRETVLEDGRKKQNVKELLTRLKHHNSSFRTAAIRSLTEYLNFQKDEVHQHLGPLIQGIAGMSLDIEKTLRRESFKLLGTLFALFSASTIEPFFEIISSYLRCAMTHIQQTIQEDSLLMLDVLLIHCPNLVAGNSNRIFSNFLDMISKFRSDDKPGRTLTSNVGNKITTIKWRTKILERLKDMLRTMIEHRKSIGKLSDGVAVGKPIDQKFFVPNVTMYCPLYRSNLNSTYDLSSVLVRSRDQVKETEGDRMKVYISQLLPLLFESWLEVRSFEKHELKKGEVLLTNDAALTLKTILSILTSLWDLAEFCDKEENDDEVCQWFRKECREKLNEHMMNAFPYQQSKGTGVSKTKSKGQATDREVQDSGGPYCINQNIELVYLYAILNHPIKRSSTEQAAHILKYLIDRVPNLKHFPPEWLTSLPKCLRQIMHTSGDNFLKIEETRTKLLLQTVLDCFQADAFSREKKTQILAILCDIILDNDLYIAYGSEQFEGWLHELPLMLCKPQVPLNVIVTLSKLGKQKSEMFLSAVRKSALVIIENFSSIQIVGCENQFEGKKNLMNIFYWIDNWLPDEREQIIEHIKKHVSDKNSLNYFLFVVSK